MNPGFQTPLLSVREVLTIMFQIIYIPFELKCKNTCHTSSMMVLLRVQGMVSTQGPFGESHKVEGFTKWPRSIKALLCREKSVNVALTCLGVDYDNYYTNQILLFP